MTFDEWFDILTKLSGTRAEREKRLNRKNLKKSVDKAPRLC